MSDFEVRDLLWYFCSVSWQTCDYGC